MVFSEKPDRPCGARRGGAGLENVMIPAGIANPQPHSSVPQISRGNHRGAGHRACACAFIYYGGSNMKRVVWLCRVAAIAALSAVLLCVLGASAGCAQIPRQASDASLQVVTGIKQLGADHIATIRAFADAQRAAVRLSWDHEHLPAVIERIRAQTGDPPDDAQVMRIAATAADLRAELIRTIDAREEQLIAVVQGNHAAVADLAEAVTGYLHAAASLDAFEHEFRNDLLDRAGIDTRWIDALLNTKGTDAR